MCGSKKTHSIDALLLNDTEYKTIHRCKKCLFEWEEKHSLDNEIKGYKYITLKINGKYRSVGLHRWVWEQSHNETLSPNEKIHHINWKKWDDRPQNLLKVRGQNEHCHQESIPMMVEKIYRYEKLIKEIKNELKNINSELCAFNHLKN
jgi:hypothetical protein